MQNIVQPNEKRLRAINKSIALKTKINLENCNKQQDSSTNFN